MKLLPAVARHPFSPMKTRLLLLALGLCPPCVPCLSAAPDAGEPAAIDAAVPSSVLMRFDRNEDGALDAEERAAWEADKAERREKYRAERAAMLERYDTDGDGRISEEEKAEAKIALQRERTEKLAERIRARKAREEERSKDAAEAMEPAAQPGDKEGAAAPEEPMMAE